jgi:hypothetical protein
MLYDLPDEVLYITTKYLQAMDRSSVTRLSLVSRTIRPVCLRVMFETIYMNPELSIPEAYELPVMFDAAREDADHLRRYVRYVVMQCAHERAGLTYSAICRTMVLEGSPSHETQDQTVSLLSKVIPKMSGLSTIRCLESIIGIWHDLYELLCSTPGITRLEIIASAWTDLASSRNMRLSSIKHLVYGQANSPPHEYRDDLMFETKTLSMFFLFHHDHLVSMEIPSELALYSLLGSVSWPNLRSVILHGYAPIDPIASEIGLFFAAAPSLRFLKMNIARTRTINDYTIFGAGPGRENKNTNTNIDVPSSFLSRLHTFSMSDPNPKDEVFRLLPRNLHSLELLSYPRPTKFNITEDLPQPPIPCSEMVRILAKSAILGLNTLRLSIGGPFDTAFIDALVLYYPSLEVLELQVLKQQDVRIDARENIVGLPSLCFR